MCVEHVVVVVIIVLDTDSNWQSFRRLFPLGQTMREVDLKNKRHVVKKQTLIAPFCGRVEVRYRQGWGCLPRCCLTVIDVRWTHTLVCRCCRIDFHQEPIRLEIGEKKGPFQTIKSLCRPPSLVLSFLLCKRNVNYAQRDNLSGYIWERRKYTLVLYSFSLVS